MLVSLFDNMEQCTDEEVARLLPLVSEQRRVQALSYSHTFGRFACLKTYLMLCELVGKRDLVFSYTGKGKPLLQDYPDLHFSISHCKNGLAVAVDKQPVGIDIESFRTFSEALLERCMNPEEAGIIREAACPEQMFVMLSPEIRFVTNCSIRSRKAGISIWSITSIVKACISRIRAFCSQMPRERR